MVVLSRISTKTGDDGTTALGDGSRVSKTDTRIQAFATVDEANSALGVVLSFGSLIDPEVMEILERVQNDLFDVGADLCTPLMDDPKVKPLRVTQHQIDFIEEKVEVFNTPLNPLRSFVLPSGTYASAQLHVARTIVRRAERDVWLALSEHGDSMSSLPAVYLNRLSDLLFVLARYLNRDKGDTLWVPGKGTK